MKHFIILSIPALALVVGLILIEPYRLDRLMAFLNPWANPKEEGYQLIQSLYSLGAGGLFGVGLFNSRQKYLFLPFAESDFIFAIIGEELGFVGALLVISIYIIIIALGIKISLNAKDRLGTYLASGITSVIAIQLLINIAVVSGSIPPTGIPMPFISAGGTSLSVFIGAIGILCNVGKCKEYKGDFKKSKFCFVKLEKN
jgi:cell division protein FtsW